MFTNVKGLRGQKVLERKQSDKKRAFRITSKVIKNFGCFCCLVLNGHYYQALCWGRRRRAGSNISKWSSRVMWTCKKVGTKKKVLVKEWEWELKYKRQKIKDDKKNRYSGRRGHGT